MAGALAEGDAVKRLRFEVRKLADGSWGLFGPGGFTGSRQSKADMSWLASISLKWAWTMLRIRSELVIKDRKGRVQDTRTYGDDPRRTRG